MLKLTTYPKVATPPRALPEDLSPISSEKRINHHEYAPIERLPHELLMQIAAYVVPSSTPYAALGGASIQLRQSMLDCAVHGLTVATRQKPVADAAMPQAEWLVLEEARRWLESVTVMQINAAQTPSTTVALQLKPHSARPASASRLGLSRAMVAKLAQVSPKLDRLGPQALWALLKSWVQEHGLLGLEFYAIQAAGRIISAYRSGETTLDLSGLGLRSLPDCIGLLSALRELRLSNNCLRMLPTTIGAMRLLEHLWLGDNQLDYLPDAFKHLTALRTLSLFHNDFTALPGAIMRMSKLEVLELNANFFAGFPEAVTDLRALKELRIDDYLYYVLPEAITYEFERRGVTVLR